MRQAAVINGGLIYAARDPDRGLHQENGAAGTISSARSGAPCWRLMAPSRSRHRRFSCGQLLVDGEVTQNNVQYGGGFDLGQMTCAARTVKLCSASTTEFMTAVSPASASPRFPDMIGRWTRSPANAFRSQDRSRAAGSPSSSRIGQNFRSARARWIRGVSRGRTGHGCRYAFLSLAERLHHHVRLYDSRLSGNA